MCMSKPKMPALPPPPPPLPPAPAPIEPVMPPPPPEQAKQVTPGIKASASKKSDAKLASSGISSLTIPLGTGARDQKSGLNIPT